MTNQHNNADVTPTSSAGKKNAVASIEGATDLFCSRLDHIDKKCLDPHVKPEEMDALMSEAVTGMRMAAETFERAVGNEKDLIKEAQTAFREKTHSLFAKSYFMNRARTWPQGYPGDYLTLEGVYRNLPQSHAVGEQLDRYFLSTTLAVAVRAREVKLRELLKTELDNRREPRVLDIACGPCREVLELAPAIKASGAVFICVDFDSDALNFSQNRISNTAEQISFRQYNALKMINPDRNEKEFGRQDVIYSVGFFDYLSDELLVRLLSALYLLLNPGGCLIASFKDSRRYRTFEYHWLVDWSAFLQRTEEEIRDLFDKAEIPADKISTTRDESGVILFFKIIL